MILIGLGAKARQGKTYVANYMKEAIPEIECYAFADELKKYCRDHHNELESQWQLAHQWNKADRLTWKDDPIYGCTPILQWFGTDVMRKKNPDYWIRIVEKRLDEEGQSAIAIITDVRFPNEADFVKESGGYLVEVIRVNEDGSRYYDPGRDPHHLSEIALDEYSKWDFVVRCKSGDLDSLRIKSLGVLRAIIKMHSLGSASVPDATGNDTETSTIGPISGGTTVWSK